MVGEYDAICGMEWRDHVCPFAVGTMVHVCQRPTGHTMPHECSCGSRVVS